MGVTIGKHIWIPCEVKPGPFPDERVIKWVSGEEDFIAFVRSEFLKDDIQKGETFVLAVISTIERDIDSFTAIIPGIAVLSKVFKGHLSSVGKCALS